MKKFVFAVMTAAVLMLNIIPVHAAQMRIYTVDGRTEKIEESAFPAWHAQGWYSAPVMKVYNLDGREMVAAISDFGVWHDQGWYSAPVMRVYNLDGREMVAAISDFGIWHAQGWYSAPVMRVYNLDGREMVAVISEFDIWHAQGWYSAPVMKVFSRSGESMIILKSDLNYWLSEGWFVSLSEAKITLYRDDGQTVEVFDDEVPTYIEAGWYTDKYVPEAVEINSLEGKYYDEYTQYTWMTITHLYDNLFQVYITRNNGANSQHIWDIGSVYLARDGKLNYSECYSYTELYNYETEQNEIIEDYYVGEGFFHQDDGYIKWHELIKGIDINSEKCKFSKLS